MKIKYLTWMAMSLLLVATACKKQRYLYPEQSPEQYTAEKDLTEALIRGAYQALSGKTDDAADAIYSPVSNWTFGDITSDDAYKGGAGTADQPDLHKIETFTADASSVSIRQKWLVCHEGVKRANAALGMLKNNPGYDDVLRAQRTAEMRFLRGHFYFELMKIFNRAVYLDENSNETASSAGAAAGATQIWTKIEEDFKAAAADLPVTQQQPQRPTRYAAWAYLCKTYIFQKKWQAASTAADEVIQHGGYQLMPNFSDLFLPENENGKEVIFAIQYDLHNEGNNAYGGALGDRLFPIGGSYWAGADGGFLRPSENLVNFYKTNSYGLPARDNRSLQDGDTVDPRLDHTIARPGIPFLDLPEVYSAAWVKDLDTYGPYSMKKRLVSPLSAHWLRVSPYTNDLNYYVIRYADVLLWKAEAVIETGDLETGRALINQIRKRAKEGSKVQKLAGGDAAAYKVEVYPWSYTCYECAIEALRDERRLEFAFEGHRFFDLVRWGEVAPVLTAYLKVEQSRRSYLSGVTFIKGTHDYQPVPVF